MSYQKCPICDGTGNISGAFAACTNATCPTCRGYRIIHEVTGLPPEFAKQDKEVNEMTERFLHVAETIIFPEIK